MSYYLLLDDIRTLKDVKAYTILPNIDESKWIIVRSYDEFASIINNLGLPTFVSFDHDLGISSYSEYFNSVKNGYINYENICEMTGLDCAKYLINYCIEKDFQFPKYAVHSMNPIGKQNIISLIESF